MKYVRCHVKHEACDNMINLALTMSALTPLFSRLTEELAALPVKLREAQSVELDGGLSRAARVRRCLRDALLDMVVDAMLALFGILGVARMAVWLYMYP